jgi:hypothetical protein
MAPDFVHQIIEQAYKTLESSEAAESFKREYRAKHGGHKYYVGKAPSVECAPRIRYHPWKAQPAAPCRPIPLSSHLVRRIKYGAQAFRTARFRLVQVLRASDDGLSSANPGHTSGSPIADVARRKRREPVTRLLGADVRVTHNATS